MSKTNEILRNQYLSHPPRHDVNADFATANAEASLQAVLASTPTGFVQAITELMEQNPDRSANTIARLARDKVTQFGMKKNRAEQDALTVQSALVRLHRTKAGSRTNTQASALTTPELIKNRLDALRRRQVEETAEGLFRIATHGHKSAVTFTDDPSQIGFRVIKRSVWDVYRGAFKGWSATCTTFDITVPRLWLTRVSRPGLAVVDGLMTLDAEPLVSPHDGIEVYAATWAAQGRGCDVRVEQGVIARVGGITFHGTSIRSAVQGVRRKIQAQPRPVRNPVDRSARRMSRLAGIEHRHGHAIVTLDDSYAVGNCDSGTQAWCHAIGIEPECTTTTLARVIEGYRRHPEDAAWAVILHVNRRCSSVPLAT